MKPGDIMVDENGKKWMFTHVFRESRIEPFNFFVPVRIADMRIGWEWEVDESQRPIIKGESETLSWKLVDWRRG